MPPLIQLVLTLAVIGFLTWLILTYIPMPDLFKKVILVIVVIAVILWLCNVFGLFANMGNLHIGH